MFNKGDRVKTYNGKTGYITRIVDIRGNKRYVLYADKEGKYYMATFAEWGLTLVCKAENREDK